MYVLSCLLYHNYAFDEFLEGGISIQGSGFKCLQQFKISLLYDKIITSVNGVSKFWREITTFSRQTPINVYPLF